MASSIAGPSGSSIFHISSVAAPSSKTESTSSATHYVHLSGHSPLHFQDEDEDDDEMYEDDGSQGSRPRLAIPGQTLGTLSTRMRGHGTHLSPSSHPSQPASIASSLTGRVILTNKLLSLQPFYARYTPETGDLVLGRVHSVLPGARRWKINLGSTALSNLALSAVNLPGGIQRRKLASDELEMRTFFKEGDLLVAEVQGVYQDGSTSLHTRSLRYGKLRNGRLVCVPTKLTRRGKSHFVQLTRKGSKEASNPSRSKEGNVDVVEMILGLNGWIWLSAAGAMQGSATAEQQRQQELEGIGGKGTGRDIDASGTYSDELKLPPMETLSTLSLLSTLLTLMARAYLPISDQSVQLAWDVAEEVQQSGTSKGGDYWTVVMDEVKRELKVTAGGRGQSSGQKTTAGGRYDADAAMDED